MAVRVERTFNLNIIGVPRDKTASLTNNDGQRIFAPLFGSTKILLSEGDFAVVDGSGTDRANVGQIASRPCWSKRRASPCLPALRAPFLLLLPALGRSPHATAARCWPIPGRLMPTCNQQIRPVRRAELGP
jgi:hypothetical protein